MKKQLSIHGTNNAYTMVCVKDNFKESTSYLQYRCLDALKQEKHLGNGRWMHIALPLEYSIFQEEEDFIRYIEMLNHKSLQCWCEYLGKTSDKSQYIVKISAEPYHNFVKENMNEMIVRLKDNRYQFTKIKDYQQGPFAPYSTFNYIIWTFAMLRLTTIGNWGHAARIGIELSKHTDDYFKCMAIGISAVLTEPSESIGFLYPRLSSYSDFNIGVREFLLYSIPRRNFTGIDFNCAEIAKIKNLEAVTGEKNTQIWIKLGKMIQENHNQGIQLIKDGQYEAGLDKINRAIKL